ncbi:peptidase T [Vibrio sp. SS-MA-C1-2]|uniref:peptidase T n=1 Tax=Vibrio sp. SS-MA-C1-2 TaxID=2908646 RepID=UPI001F2B290A|nr:peptidase T [Vibrio sp. SS-MA-C1-2]UJF18118.1 peptidase T [Vibrio sp. SS-MA-C1-2]
MNQLVDRFMRYVAFDTQSDSESTTTPSTSKQLTFAQFLRDELTSMGLADVSLDENGYLMARLPSNVVHSVPAIGFIAHMDTAMDASGANVKPQLVENYQGGEIALGNGEQFLSPSQYPDLNKLLGHDLITTDGSTLLGADNKAGIAEIITAIATLQANPSIPHGDICIGFTPDEEIGRGANFFDVKKFGAEWAYTIDGGPVGELEFENFNASTATVICHGNNVHPGSAKDKMVNSMTIAGKFISRMPKTETPECTEGYEGFYHLKSMIPAVATTELSYIVRDFDLDKMTERKQFMLDQAAQLNEELEKGSVEVQITDSYFNMREKVIPHMHIIDVAKQAMFACDIEPMIKPIRGGTDGARLSFMGLPCPNIFTGGYNFHGIHEFITIDGMKQAVDVIVKIAELTSEKK